MLAARVIVALTVVLFAAPLCAADEASFIVEATKSAESWLAQLDQGKYDAAWDLAAPIVQMSITKPQWDKALSVTRGQLGEVKTRKLKSSQFTKTLPGAADGEYVVLQYETQFANKASGIETITPQRDKQGKWQVSGYYIK